MMAQIRLMLVAVQLLNILRIGICLESNLTVTYKELPDPGRQRCMDLASCINGRAKNCKCDRLCKVYGDCCHDAEKYFAHDLYSSDPDDHQTTSSTADLPVLSKSMFTCAIIDGIGYSKIYSINKCPSDWEDVGIARKCNSEGDTTDRMSAWPVSDKENGILYKNIYCSICHGKAAEQTLYWKADFGCPPSLPANGDTENDIAQTFWNNVREGLCALSYLSPAEGIVTRSCVAYIDTCDPYYSDQDIVQQCEHQNERTVSFVHSQGKTFRNEYCAKCNNMSDWHCETFDQLLRTDITSYPLSLLLDLNTGIGEYTSNIFHRDMEPQSKVESLSQCPQNHVYDPYVQKCRPTSCGSGFHLRDDECVQLARMAIFSEQEKPRCLQHVLNYTEFTVLPDGQVYLNVSGEIIQESDFQFGKDETLLICTNFTQNYSSSHVGGNVKFEFDQTQAIVSMVGQIISIIALAIHFLVYSILPKLRNLAGKNLMCLVASLFVAQFLFLVGVARSEHYALCFAFAVLMHYAFLCAFCWMNVMSVDIFKTFSTKVKPSSADNNRKVFVRYSIYAWISPSIIITIATIVDLTNPDSILSPGYANGVCWITSPWALLAFFGIPVFLIVIANTILFSLTTAAICKIAKATKIVTKASDKHRLLLYVKLSTIMGLTWLFGFISMFADVRSLWYLFIILNSLQGAFICIAFVCTKTTMKLLKEKYGKAWESLRSSSATSSDTTRATLMSHSKTRSQSSESENPNQINKSKF